MTGKPSFRFHKIPTPKSEPYICIEGPDDHLWFCQSGASKIGRLNVESGVIDEFALPEAGAMPIGITPGSDGAMWFCAKRPAYSAMPRLANQSAIGVNLLLLPQGLPHT